LALLGRHQALNALVAIRCLEAAGRYRVLPEAAEAALATVRMPGRLERLDARPDVLLDGAHNPPAAEALAGFLDRAGHGRRVSLVFNALADKDLTGLFAPLAALAGRVLVPPVANARGRVPAETAAHLRAMGADAHPVATVEEALGDRRADDVATLVTGSLFLVGEARRVILGAPDDPVGRRVLQ
jgi:dihydrofolate synthase/folylpolyglutamate synthase